VRRVYVIVEGPTEESFLNNVVAPLLGAGNVSIHPISIGTPGHKGGRTNYARVKQDVVVTLKQYRGAYCSTMIDFYGLGKGFPGLPVPGNLSNMEKVELIEQAFKEDIIATIRDLRPDIRFLPYIQLHEYEGLLFSDPESFAAAINRPEAERPFREIRNSFATPEDINDDWETAPSRRVLRAVPSYKKVIHGTLAAQKIGMERIRRECPHFHDWILRLEALTDLQ
jgi:hypothetical protein